MAWFLHLSFCDKNSISSKDQDETASRFCKNGLETFTVLQPHQLGAYATLGKGVLYPEISHKLILPPKWIIKIVAFLMHGILI